jgi:hypothetical protein
MLVFAITALAVTICSVLAAARMAANRARSQRVWILAAALFGPLPLPILFALPRRNSSDV